MLGPFRTSLDAEDGRFPAIGTRTSSTVFSLGRPGRFPTTLATLLTTALGRISRTPSEVSELTEACAPLTAGRLALGLLEPNIAPRSNEGSSFEMADTTELKSAMLRSTGATVGA